MAWDPPLMGVNALVPAQHPYVEEEGLIEFKVQGDHLGDGQDLHLVLVRSDFRLTLLHNATEAVIARLRAADIIPLTVTAVAGEREATCTALLRERPPGTYDLVVTRPPTRADGASLRNNANVLRSALEILEPVCEA